MKYIKNTVVSENTKLEYYIFVLTVLPIKNDKTLVLYSILFGLV